MDPKNKTNIDDIKFYKSEYEDAEKLAELIKHIPSKVNLIPYNEWPGSPFKGSNMQVVKDFANILIKKGIVTTIF